MTLNGYWRLSAAACVAALGLAAGNASHAGGAAPAQIAIQNFNFEPMSLTVAAGSTVTWANKDEEPHTVVSDSGLFRSGAIDTGETFGFKFDTPGTYHFTCSIHPKMVGTIVVR